MGKKTYKAYNETHISGLISIEQNLTQSIVHGDFGIQIARDGRVWICVDGRALIRFRPHTKAEEKNGQTEARL